MRKLSFLFFTIITISSSAQDISKGIDSMRKQLAKDMASYDSAKKVADSLMIFNNKRFDSLEMARFNEQNSRNLDGLVSMMKEREQKQKQGMWLRLGFGILMLGVLIFGLLRKRKKKNIQ
jgi:hypothetical protein